MPCLMEKKSETVGAWDLFEILLSAGPLSSHNLKSQVSGSWSMHWTLNDAALLWQEVEDGWNETVTTCPHTWHKCLEFQDTPQSIGLCQQEFSSGAKVYLGIWLPAFILWSACSIQQHRPDFLASSQQSRAAKTNKCRHCAGYRAYE